MAHPGRSNGINDNCNYKPTAETVNLANVIANKIRSRMRKCHVGQMEEINLDLGSASHPRILEFIQHKSQQQQLIPIQKGSWDHYYLCGNELVRIFIPSLLFAFFNENGQRIKLGSKAQKYLDDILNNYGTLDILGVFHMFFGYSWRVRYKSVFDKLERKRKNLVAVKNKGMVLPVFDEDDIPDPEFYNKTICKEVVFPTSITFAVNSRSRNYALLGAAKIYAFIVEYDCINDRINGGPGDVLGQLFKQNELSQDVIDQQFANHPLYMEEKPDYEMDEEGFQIFAEAMDKTLNQKKKEIKKLYIKAPKKTRKVTLFGKK